MVFDYGRGKRQEKSIIWLELQQRSARSIGKLLIDIEAVSFRGNGVLALVGSHGEVHAGS